MHKAMTGLMQMVRNLIDRLSREQETALRKITERKTVRARLDGFAKSERAKAKFYLLALAPFVPLLVSDEIGWPRGMIWWGWFWLGLSWALIIIAISLASYWRAFWSSSHRDR